MSLETLSLVAPAVEMVEFYPNVPDSELIDDFKILAEDRWSFDLASFAEDAFPSHLRLTMPAYHKLIYTALARLTINQSNMTNVNSMISDNSMVITQSEQSQLNVGVKTNVLKTTPGTPPNEVGESKLPPPKSLQKNRKQARKSSKEIKELLEVMVPVIEGNKNLAIVEPREFGKSTKAMVFVMNAVLNKKKKFILYISKSYEHAVKLIGPIKAEFESNEDIDMVYGNVRGHKWTEGELEFKMGKDSAKILAVGRGQSVRGLKYLNWRPDLIILDDIEDDKEVENKELRLELQMWLDRQVMPGVDSATGNIVAFGTILHPDSLLANLTRKKERLLKYSTFDVLFFAALDASDQSIWEEKFSTARLIEERRLDPFKFAQERMNQPIPIGSGMFKTEYFKYFSIEEDGIHEGERIIALEDCNLYLTCDIAMTEKSYSDYTVLMITAVSPDNEYFVLEYTRQRWEDPDKIINELFRLNAKYPSIQMNGIEAVAAQKWLLINLKKTMKERNIFLRFCELKADTDKLRRISQLQPRFAANGIFLRNHMGTLEEELLLFPKSAHDDISDALSYVPQIARPGEKKDSKPIRFKGKYVFSVLGEDILERLQNKNKATGIFKEYTSADEDDFKEEFEETMIKKWMED